MTRTSSARNDSESLARLSTTRTTGVPAHRKRREEGVVMLVALLLIVTATALATVATHMTTFELRAAGYTRHAMQAQYLAETGLMTSMALVDEMGPVAILHSIKQADNVGTVSKPEMAPFEPELANDKQGYRMYSGDTGTLTAHAPTGEDALGASAGTGQPYVPVYTVDINDHHTYQAAVAGERADGRARLHYMRATFTARGRMRLRDGDFTGTTGTDTREYHEVIGSARAQGISGPFAP